jgi:colanic acid biosynthesis glycosyl transferase WcaI
VRILVYGLNFTPELTGIGKYTGEMAAWLASRGHDVRVVTAPPYYPQWKVLQGYSNARWRTERDAEVQVWRCPLWVPANAGGLKRILHLCTFAISSFPVLFRQLFWRPQIVWVVAPALACAPGAALVARLARAKSWLHIQDFEVDAAFSMGLLKGARLRRAFLTAEGWLLRRFDRVSTISGRMMALAAGKQLRRGQLVFFPNWVDISAIQHQPGSDLRSELGLGLERVVALYSGNMGNKQGLEVLAEVARILADDPRFFFVFCGDGTGREDLVRRCAGLDNVLFLPLQPLSRLSDLLAMADVHLLPQRADAADLVMPSKLGGMLASGRPVVATAAPSTEVADVVERQAGAGLVVPPEDPQAFARAMLQLASDPALRQAMGRRGRAFAETELDRQAVLQQFEARVLELVGNPPRDT